MMIGIGLSLFSHNLNADIIRGILDKIVVSSTSASPEIETITNNVAEQILKISMIEEDKKFVESYTVYPEGEYWDLEDVKSAENKAYKNYLYSLIFGK